jgi:predicted RNA-binding Zn-ribbon protein involved in translation (DUF1610 family)
VTTIKATCPQCGEVDLTPEDIRLTIGSADKRYGFSCPTCSDYIEKAADDRVVRLLLSGGVLPVVSDVPAEVLEAKAGGSPISLDDLLEFHELLATEDWFDTLRAASA